MRRSKRPECPKQETKKATNTIQDQINGFVAGAVDVMLNVLFYSPVGSPGPAVWLDHANEGQWLCANEEAATLGAVQGALGKAHRVQATVMHEEAWNAVGGSAEGEAARWVLKHRFDFKGLSHVG